MGKHVAISAWKKVFNHLFGRDVFISYSARDRAWAEAVEKLIKLGKLRAFRDATGIHAGDRLERLLDEVRRSTMLVVLVSDSSLQSEWVKRELEAYCERPREQWRIAPVFLNDRYPAGLPPDFEVLRQFLGVSIPLLALRDTAAVEGSRELLGKLTSQFRATRKATRQRAVAAAIIAAACMAFGLVIWRRQIDSRKDEFIKAAEVARANSRFDEAELSYAKAWVISHDGSILAGYRDARARRILEKPVRLRVDRDDSIVAVDAGGGDPYLVLHNSKEPNALSVIRGGRRSVLQSPCSVDPRLALASATVIWVCGADLGMANVGDQISGKKTVRLPAEPVAMRLQGDRLDLLFREGAVAQVGTFAIPALAPRSLDILHGAREAGEIGLCPATSGSLGWSVSAEGGRIVTRVWKEVTANAQVLPMRAPSGTGGSDTRPVSWISRVRVSPDCEKFFVEYALFTLGARSDFEMVRIRPTSPRPIDRFDSDVSELIAAPDESGIEAMYLTGSSELRAFLLTSPIVISTRITTLASGVKRIGGWISDKGVIWTFAVEDDVVSIFRNRELWARYVSDIGEPIRVIVSRDGSWIVFEGDAASILWRRAPPWNGSVPDAPDRIALDLQLHK
jgi:hypothetical protein